ncbi:uncharacterized protein LOC122004088 isoform X1 [Zingiber officinale]|uniref:uncharacterized protein LOC122004088 isoform X1 n=1 Tax=Zingiber officinale TaxID=94328 RepID=UPI001C4DB52C|nr:uncharacterized protein LOC122004088 isoform X1 [Zingiber officinale]
MASLTGMAKQRELNGILLSESEPRSQKRMSDAKSRELSGHDIFAPPPREFPLKLQAQKVAELRGNGGERTVSEAKQREMAGNDIFGKGEGAAPSRDYLGGVRKPPGSRVSELTP